MLILTGEIHDLRHLGLGDLVGENATDTDAAPVNMEHDPSRLIAGLLEKPLQHMHHEFHRSVVVVQHQDLVHGGLACLGPGLDHHACAGTVPSTVAPVAIAHRAIANPREENEPYRRTAPPPSTRAVVRAG